MSWLGMAKPGKAVDARHHGGGLPACPCAQAGQVVTIGDMVTTLPAVSLDRVLKRVSAIWGPDQAAHHVLYGQTGSGKSTLVKGLLTLCKFERVLICDPKSSNDPVWSDPDPLPVGQAGPADRRAVRLRRRARRRALPHVVQADRVPRPPRHRPPVRRCPGDRRGRGEHHFDFGRYQGNLPPAAAGRAGRLGVVPRQVGQRSVGLVGHRKLLGRRTAAVRHDLFQAGHTSGLPAAKAAAELLSWRGRDLQDLAGSVRPHQWIYQDQQQGSAGACLCP